MSAEVLHFEGEMGQARRGIGLAHEEPFRLGSLSVEPGLRQISAPDGRRQTVEPRVMQVLVALARANGAIVSRDDLIRTCWNGTIVSDDAINRPISLLRRLAERTGGGTFGIETIARVGYRLVVPKQPPASDDATTTPIVRRMPLWIGLAALLVASAGLTIWQRAPQGPSYSVSLEPFRIIGAAGDFNDRLNTALTSHDVPTVGGRNSLTLTGSVEQHGADFTVNARLVDPASHAVLWSGALNRPSVGPTGLPGAATVLGLIAQCTLAGANDAGTVTPEVLSLYARTCELGSRGQTALGLRVARELTRQTPDFAAGWFALSHHALTLYQSQPRGDVRLREEALAAARKLVALRPNAQDGYVSEAMALDPRQRLERERLLRRAVGLDPVFVDRAQIVLSDFLLEVGRTEESFQLNMAIVQQNPDQPAAYSQVFLTAAATGRWAVVDEALTRIKKLDPAHVPALLWRKAVWRGDWAEAARYLPWMDPALRRAGIATYRALQSGDPEQKRAAAQLVANLDDGCCQLAQAELLAQLGRTAQAIALLDAFESAPPSSTRPRNVPLLFLADPAMRSLWYDPAIEPFFRRNGWIDYWRASRTRPDICNIPGAPAFCGLLKPRT